MCYNDSSLIRQILTCIYQFLFKKLFNAYYSSEVTLYYQPKKLCTVYIYIFSNLIIKNNNKAWLDKFETLSNLYK